jgi:uncharacterized membrane protein
MQIKFQNNYKVGVNVAIAYYNTSCSPPWQSEGWWGIEPGNSVHVINTCNRYLFFYAEAVDGAYWAGPYRFQVAEGVFSFCVPLLVLVSPVLKWECGRSTTELEAPAGRGTATRLT